MRSVEDFEPFTFTFEGVFETAGLGFSVVGVVDDVLFGNVVFLAGVVVATDFFSEGTGVFDAGVVAFGFEVEVVGLEGVWVLGLFIGGLDKSSKINWIKLGYKEFYWRYS